MKRYGQYCKPTNQMSEEAKVMFIFMVHKKETSNSVTK